MPTQTINMTQLREKLASYLSAAECGEEIIVTIHGRAIVRISSVQRPRRSIGLLKGKIAPQPADAWDFPDDLADIMEGKSPNHEAG